MEDLIPTGPPHSEFARRSWPATADQLTSVRAEVRGWLEPLDLSEDARQDLLFAVSEAVTNCIEHAYAGAPTAGDVEITFWTDDLKIWFEIVDHGQWREPTVAPEGASGGRGIGSMQRLVDGVMIQYDARGTRVLLRHRLPGQAHDLSAVSSQPVSLQAEASPGA